MSADNKCKCPLCNQNFNPADGETAVETLAKGVIAVYAEMQKKASQDNCADNLPCGRCGSVNMAKAAKRNALSRIAEIYICDDCGMKEAVQEFNGTPLPIFHWWIVKEILAIK